ncbi:MAG: hypothetical protein LBL08_02320, partial [Candidatus Nomurabacteria bacterium]|nr:hypothetical protein [Candidatus Nomurabacteria bacterium]
MNLRDRVFGVMFRYGTFGVRREVLISVFGAGIAVAFLILTLILPKLSGEAATDTTITPSYGPSAGGTEIEITGDFTPPAPTTMQGMTAEYCATMTIYDGTNPGAILGPLTDIRVDGSGKTQDYRVARLADGNCWMLDNLKLQLYNQMTLTRADTNVANKTTVSINWLADGFPIGQTSGNFVTGGHLTKTGAAFSASTDMDAWRQVDPSGRTECTQISTYNPATLTKCGYLYNWYTATAGSSLSNFSSLSDSDTAYSICPANWRLPRGNNTDAWQNDFAVLNGFMAGDGAPYDDNSTNYTYYNNWLPAGKFQGTYSGSWFSGYNGLGITGDLWSSTRNGDLAYAADFGNNALSIYPANSSASYQRQRGFAVRCMSLPYQGPETPTIDFDGDTVTADNRYDNPDGTTTLTVTTPAHAAGVTDLTIHINGADFTLPAAYTFYDPMDITDINPDKGPTAGGTVVEITGHNLTAPINDSMQAFTADHCASLPIYNKDDPDPASTVELTDSRNGAKDLVRRLQDGKCWMTDNLRIADFSATAANTDLNTITDFYIPPLDTSGNNNNYDPYVYGPVTGDIEVGGAENYGYLYNYVAATAGEVSTSIINNTAPNSICPVGWRMPTSAYDYDDPNSDFAQLNIAMFGDSTLTDSGNYQDTAHYANWIYDGSNPSAGSFRGVLSGRFNGSFNNQGAVGFYWSSSATDPDNAYTLIINSNSSGSVSPNVDGSPDRSAGVAVRCLTEAGTPIQPSVPTVKFGSESATNVSVVDNPDGTQTITATTPQNTAGKTTVTVDNGLTTATTFFAYYDPLTIDEVNPDKGPVAGGTVVEIKGDFPESIPKLTLQEMTQAYCES